MIYVSPTVELAKRNIRIAAVFWIVAISLLSMWHWIPATLAVLYSTAVMACRLNELHRAKELRQTMAFLDKINRAVARGNKELEEMMKRK